MTRKITLLFIIAACLLAVSCAKEEDESADLIQKRILDAYLVNNYPNIKPTKSGLVILSKTEGTGETPIDKNMGVYISYSIKSLSGAYQATNQESVAKQLGNYAKTNYYGPSLFEVGFGTTIKGVEEAITGMKKGGKVVVIIPPWLSSYSANADYGSSTGGRENTTNLIYEIEIKSVIKDIIKFQIDSLQSYSNRYYSGMDSTSYGFYFTKLKDLKTDTIAAEKSADVWYVGRLLDGYVFDTNIADTAKKYGIYNSSKSYTALSVTYAANVTTMKDNNSIVAGYAQALKKMSYGEIATTFFYSNLGYGAEAQSSSNIGSYQPLVFYLKVEKPDQ
jgi:FKBP-type peptidyl-prolyl cis-trans isomerase